MTDVNTAPTRSVWTPRAKRLDPAAAIQAAETTEEAFCLLSPSPGDPARRKALLQGCLSADALVTNGHAAIESRLAAGRAVPRPWIDKLVGLEGARLDAIWALGDHDAERTPPADVEDRTPSALAARVMTPATRRLGELDPPDCPEVRAAVEDLERHGPGWDHESLRAACRRLIEAALRARYAPAALAGSVVVAS